MAKTKTVSLRVPTEDLEELTEAGIEASEVMRAALHAEARRLRADRWLRDVKKSTVKPPPGTPTAAELVRMDRDSH